MIVLDGSFGEGGGQILRSALALSATTGKSFKIERIRAGRAKSGLLRQHLTAVMASAQICGGHVEGAELRSETLVFEPGPVRPGAYDFAIGSAGSANLVLQTVLPPLLLAGAPSEITVAGGTHNPSSPPWHFLARCYLPLLVRMGAVVKGSLSRWGFYPAGGGALRLEVGPCERLRPIDLRERGQIRRWSATAVVAGNVPEHVGVRELAELRRLMELPRDVGHVLKVASHGPGNALMLEAECEGLTELFVGFGEKGVPAETVAARVAAEAIAWRDGGHVVGEHLADQLLLPMALSGGGSFLTSAPTEHTRTNIAVIERFLPVRFRLVAQDSAVRVEVGGL